MAVQFPLSFAYFWDKLPIARCGFVLPDATTISRTRGGELLQAETGSRLWTAEVKLDLMLPAEADEVLPIINLLRGAGRTFLAGDPRRPFPRRDPTGSILGTATVQIASVSGRDMTLKGLPAGYVLSRSDMLAFTYGTNPVRYALHQVVTPTTTAAGTGITPVFEVVPPLRTGATVDTTVLLKRPLCKAMIDPDSVQPGTARSGGLVEGVAFTLKQTLR